MEEMFMSKDQHDPARILRIPQYAEATGQVAKTCRYLASAAAVSTGGAKPIGSMATPAW
jgi:hypothetical protein